MTITGIQFKGDIIGDILSDPGLKSQVKDIIKVEFEADKEILLDKFDEHDVTQEINDPDSSNISGTLGGYGNLFGFLGFEEETDPIKPVRNYLEKSIILKSIVFPEQKNQIRNSKGQFASGQRVNFAKININKPDLDDFDGVADLPWDSKNWVKGIERGVSGFQYFMSKHLTGRSNEGFQMRNPIQRAQNQFKKVPYMTSLLNEFEKSFQKSLKTI